MLKTFVYCLVATYGGGLLYASDPTCDSIDYSAPSQYLDIPATLGDRKAIAQRAAQLKGHDDRATLRKVLKWMHSTLEYNPDVAYQWRNYDDVVRERCYGGCADEAIVCGVLLRSAGIPAIWVKTMDVPWIWDLKKERPFQSWSGHVFLEVYLDGKWALLDPGAQVIYTDYSTKSRLLPGNRFAYHKGSDPKQMIMSLQWDEWKSQTRTYFEALDESLLPVDSQAGTSLVPQVYVAGNAPYYQALQQMARSEGWSVKTAFNCEYEKYLPAAKGHTLLIETHDGVPIVPVDLLDTYFPKASDGLDNDQLITHVSGTTIMFVDFSQLLDALEHE